MKKHHCKPIVADGPQPTAGTEIGAAGTETGTAGTGTGTAGTGTGTAGTGTGAAGTGTGIRSRHRNWHRTGVARGVAIQV